MDDVKNLTLRLPEPLLDQLRQIAKREQRSINSLIVVTLGQFAGGYTGADRP